MKKKILTYLLSVLAFCLTFAIAAAGVVGLLVYFLLADKGIEDPIYAIIAFVLVSSLFICLQAYFFRWVFACLRRLFNI